MAGKGKVEGAHGVTSVGDSEGVRRTIARRIRDTAGVSLAGVVLLAAVAGSALAGPDAAAPPQVERGWLTMKDGVRLSVTYFKPAPHREGERLPVLLELLPYRKDDQFYLRDWPIHGYFAGHGFVTAKVDIRGTGSSEGHVPPREYSEAELDDAVEIIRQLAGAPWSNGKVGMFGISWGGFNALQVAARRPPGLGAILALHASDDLYHDDVHYIDGILHVDEYELQIDMDNGLPRSPDYRLDPAYFQERFEAYPWFFTYLKQQTDGPFWRQESLRWHYRDIDVPVYVIGGLLDGYRDTVPRLLENLKVPVRAAIGPWNHAWPDDGVPGPNYEWRQDAVRWFRQWLCDEDTGLWKEPRLMLFVREPHPPDLALAVTPGHWRSEEWPIAGTTWRSFHPSADHGLLPAPGSPAVHRSAFVPSYGAAAGSWWGEPTGDMRSVDGGSLVYDSDVLEAPIETIGFPRVHLVASVDAPLADWVVRLEDVHPNGEVSLLTGAAQNGAQRRSRLEPEDLVPGEANELAFGLHFTTWTFQPGHRIRLAVSNGLFPMFWPTPHRMTASLQVGVPGTRLELPQVPPATDPAPQLPPPEPRQARTGARALEDEEEPRTARVCHDLGTGRAHHDVSLAEGYQIGEQKHHLYEKHRHEVDDTDPAHARYQGEAGHRIELPGRTLELITFFTLESDETTFHAVFRRRLSENGKVVREREWDETFPRRWQ